MPKKHDAKKKQRKKKGYPCLKIERERERHRDDLREKSHYLKG